MEKQSASFLMEGVLSVMLSELENKIGYSFSDKNLIKNAMTHSSYAHEHRTKGLQSNERLEFLGDSVLGFLCAEYLFGTYGDLPEGELTKIRAAVVCEHTLYETALQFSVNTYLFLGCGEETGGGRSRPSTLADALEALIAAIYLDGGIEKARKFVMKFIVKRANEAFEGRCAKDYKTTLQEIVQKNRQEILSYRLKEEAGPDHDKRFTVELLLNSNIFSEGTGRSKKEAEQIAAKAALEMMGQ